MRYVVVIEKGDRNYSAYIPDIPGCVATGKSVARTIFNLRRALDLHVDGTRGDGDALPPSTTTCEYIEVRAGSADAERARASGEAALGEGRKGVKASFGQMVRDLVCPSCGANFTKAAIDWADAWMEGRFDLMSELGKTELDGPYKLKCEFCQHRSWLNYFAGTVTSAEPNDSAT